MLWAGVPFAQNSQNVSLVFQYDDSNIGGYNDIWGYEDSGTEVAIIGTTDSLLFFDITNTSQVVKLPSIAPGGSSTWRDIKCHGKYCYAVTDNNSANEGLLVINMDSLLNGNITYQAFTGEFYDAHNIFIDAVTDKLYVVGSDHSAGNDGYIVYDLGPDPYNPTHLATVDLSSYLGCTNSYLHDGYARNDTLYGNAIYGDCGYHILEVSNPSSPVYLGGLPGSAFQNGYNHSNWITEDGKFAVVAEETHGNPIHIVDISDPSDPMRIATWKDPLESDTDNIAHNPIIKGNYCYISYYHDGLCVLDISDPYNPVRVAYYDTYPSNTGYNGYQGAWGVYPLLPSGMVLISDRSNGLHVLEVSPSVLPVEWFSFNAFEKEDHEFRVTGNFQSTESLEKAELLWSDDGRNFKPLQALRIQLSHSNIYDFDQTLPRPTRAAFFIKVKTTEIDGFTEYSQVRKLNAAAGPDIQLYPNPVNDHFWIENAKGYDLEIRNTKGLLILSKHIQNNLEKVGFSRSLSEGMYLIHLRSSDSNEYITRRILLQQ